ncbi:MAG: hypothetical protein AAB922_04850, partial [Patescibacteria group bacterium]
IARIVPSGSRITWEGASISTPFFLYVDAIRHHFILLMLKEKTPATRGIAPCAGERAAGGGGRRVMSRFPVCIQDSS